MNNIYARLSLSAAAGALAGLVQTLIIVVLSNLGMFLVIGLPLKIPFTLPYVYQRVTWGGLWGLLFLIPIVKGWPNWQRGLIFAAGPAAASLFYFLPFVDELGWLGLQFGVMMPPVVIAFALLWGFIAGSWLDRAYGLVRDDA